MLVYEGEITLLKKLFYSKSRAFLSHFVFCVFVNKYFQPLLVEF